VAFAIALVTAFSYLELVTKYPKAAPAALNMHKAFGIHVVTFLVAFTVMCSGITSASTASKALAAKLADGFGLEPDNTNLVLTLVELSGLLLAITAATSLAFFAMVGFEDAVNVAEETHDPVRNFPRMMLAGLGITGVIYLLSAVFAVANSALINMLMASRLLYGMARQGLLPPVLGWVHRGRQTPWVAIILTTVIALGLITNVIIAVLVLRRDPI
jgi:amino acid transporter